MIFILHTEGELYVRPTYNDIPEDRKVPCTRVIMPYLRIICDGSYTAMPCLAYVDPYIDTIYNRLQAPAILGQWLRLYELSWEEQDLDTLKRVERLIERCRDERGMYLRFMAD